MFAYYGIPIVNSLPEGFPGTSFKQDAREFRNCIDRLMQDTFEDVLKQNVCGSIFLVVILLRNVEKRVSKTVLHLQPP